MDATTNEVIGLWKLPIQVRAQRVEAPPTTEPPPTVCVDTDGDGVDVDGDGFCSIADGGDDCDDYNAEVHPGHKDWGKWGRDGVDNNCDGFFD